MSSRVDGISDLRQNERDTVRLYIDNHGRYHLPVPSHCPSASDWSPQWTPRATCSRCDRRLLQWHRCRRRLLCKAHSRTRYRTERLNSRSADPRFSTISPHLLQSNVTNFVEVAVFRSSLLVPRPLPRVEATEVGHKRIQRRMT